MSVKTPVNLITNYYNSGENKLPATQWVAELKKLTPEDKMELAAGIAAITGDTVKAA